VVPYFNKSKALKFSSNYFRNKNIYFIKRGVSFGLKFSINTELPEWLPDLWGGMLFLYRFKRLNTLIYKRKQPIRFRIFQGGKCLKNRVRKSAQTETPDMPKEV